MYFLLSVVILFNLLDSLALSEENIETIIEIESLITTESDLLDTLELYVIALEKKAKLIRRNLERMRAENKKALLDVDTYLKNPLQTFSLVRRLHDDWTHWQVYVQKPIGNEFAKRIRSERQNLPTRYDLFKVADRMHQIQDTFGLSPLDMSNGILNGIQYKTNLSAVDCFSMGIHLQGKGIYCDAELWYESAVNLFEDDDSMNKVLEFNLTEVLWRHAQVSTELGKLQLSVDLLTRLISIDPKCNFAMHQIEHLVKQIKSDKNSNTPPHKHRAISTIEKYKKCCRGNTHQRMPNLYCIYNTTTHPFLKLAPLKMELLSLDPYMIIYHDVISDNEIANLQALAKLHLERASVFIRQRRVVLSMLRNSEIAVIEDNSTDTTKRINQRIADMTGFDLSNSNPLEVVKYSVGEHYYPHVHFSTKVNKRDDHIATILFYMSDVEQGGATVFTNINMAVDPKKGAALMWYDLNERGEGDSRTTHASCPIIYGTKWVATRQIHENDQIFRRPCF